MKRFLAVITLIFMLASQALALSDAEFTKWKKTNADFARADKMLNEVWAKIKKNTSKEVFEIISEEQKEWLASGRDDDAEDFIYGGSSRVEAYTMATNFRVDFLLRRVRDLTEELKEDSKGK